MMLPKINNFPMYDSVIPSTQQKIRFRPYNVGEEKTLLIAYEGDNKQEIAKAILDIVLSCVEDNIDKKQLAVFDVEYLFLQIRSKAVGESSTIVLSCGKCEHGNEVEVKVDQIKIDPGDFPETRVNITDEYALDLKFPLYLEVIEDSEGLRTDSLNQLLFELVIRSLDKLHTPEELINFKDVPTQEVVDFISNLTTEQYGSIVKFIENLPKLSQEINYGCTECGHKNEYNLQGLSDFF